MSRLGQVRAWAHMRALWPRYTLVPAMPFILWPAYCLAIGERRWELFVFMVVGAILPYWSTWTKKLYVGIVPIGLVGILYDSMRFVKNVGITPDRVHLCDLRAIELTYFGVTVQGERVTLQDWLQAHPVPALDVFFAIPYGTFIGASFLFAAFLYFKDYQAMRRFTASFLAMNFLGFVTYHAYPAAPPWYFHAHGCTADLLSRASEGPNLARVDAMLGFAYFGAFYGRSNDVFGAVPSLHVAYPLLIVLEGWRAFGSLERLSWLRWPLRVGALAFFVSMCAAAVYLDHHWIVDVIVGIVYAVVVFVLFRWIWARGESQAPVANAMAGAE